MRFLLDESVRGDVWKMLQGKDIPVERSVDALGFGADDKDVVKLGDSLDAVVIDANCRDFRKLIARRPANNNLVHRSASRISLRCKPKRQAERIESLLGLISDEWERRQGLSDKRLIVEIADDFVVVFR